MPGGHLSGHTWGRGASSFLGARRRWNQSQSRVTTTAPNMEPMIPLGRSSSHGISYTPGVGYTRETAKMVNKPDDSDLVHTTEAAG